MPLFTDITFDEHTGRYEFQFVNQQYDFLMAIYYDPQTKTYRFNCSDEEATRIARSYGRDDFDPAEWLKYATEELEKRRHQGDRKNDH